MMDVLGSAPQSNTPSPLNPDALTLHQIATGLLHISQQSSRGQGISLPYPPSLQRGLNRLAATCLQRGVPPPMGVPELFAWCRQPLADWPLTLPAESVGPQDRLLDGGLPTDLCEAWALATSDVEAELTEKRFFEELITTCRAAKAPESYVAFRRLLVQEPVLTALELQKRRLNPALAPLIELISQAYEQAPSACEVNGVVVRCSQCGNLLLRTVSDDLICENERCRAEGSLAPGHRISLTEQPLWLRRGLRRFISAPGRAELRLEGRLQELGIEVEMWPAYDSYDLRLTFPTGQIWAVDVKDWANPFLLAGAAKPFATFPTWQRAFFVFPDERKQAWPGYREAFVNYCNVLNEKTEACYESELLTLAEANLKGGRDA